LPSERYEQETEERTLTLQELQAQELQSPEQQLQEQGDILTVGLLVGLWIEIGSSYLQEG
jgi:hypothetical protein